jgi:hypothetical protein
MFLCFGTCTETPCNPKRSPLCEMTCPASSTAVISLLPVPNRMPSNSALESASGPSDNSRSRGLSSGGSCLMVYLRVPTVVFYIIQASGYRYQPAPALGFRSSARSGGGGRWPSWKLRARSGIHRRGAFWPSALFPERSEACGLMPSALRFQGCGIPALASILLVRASGRPTMVV